MPAPVIDFSSDASGHPPLGLWVNDHLRAVHMWVVPGGVVMMHGGYKTSTFIPMANAEGWLEASGYYELDITQPAQMVDSSRAEFLRKVK